MILDPNGKETGARPPESPTMVAAKKPEDYIYEANAKAQGRTAFVGRMAEQLFHEVWKYLDEDARTQGKHLSDEMDNCLLVAEMWRKKINAYQAEQAEAIHNAEVERWAGSKIILPTWGQVKDHFPGAHNMFPGSN
jgi:hypothetical protein